MLNIIKVSIVPLDCGIHTGMKISYCSRCEVVSLHWMHPVGWIGPCINGGKTSEGGRRYLEGKAEPLVLLLNVCSKLPSSLGSNDHRQIYQALSSPFPVPLSHRLLPQWPSPNLSSRPTPINSTVLYFHCLVHI